MRPFVGWPEAQVEALRTRLQSMVEAWHGDWMPTLRPGQVKRASDSFSMESDLGWRSLETLRPGRTLWWRPLGWIEGPSEKEMLARALFGHQVAPPSLGEDALQAAWTDWWERLQSLLSPDSLAPTPTWEEPGVPLPGGLRAPLKGALFLDLPWCDGHLRLALGPAFAPAPNPVKTPLPTKVPPSFEAFHSLSLPVQACLDPLPLELGSLLSLAPGDVLCTTHPLEQPLTLAAGRHKLCAAFLGRQGDRRALELLASTPD